MSTPLSCPGVGRDKDCLTALQFYFSRPVSDDEMRYLHEVMQRAVAIRNPFQPTIEGRGYMIDTELLKTAADSGEVASQISSVSAALRSIRSTGGSVSFSAKERNELCGWLDQTATLLDELSIAAQLDAEENKDDAV